MIGATALLRLVVLQLATLSTGTNALQTTHRFSRHARRGVRRRAGEDDSVPQPDPIYSDEAVVALRAQERAGVPRGSRCRGLGG